MSKSVVVWKLDGVVFKTDPMPHEEAACLYNERNGRSHLGVLELWILCDRCGLHPTECSTTDNLNLCATCAQDTHMPCGGCGDVVPTIETDGEDAWCLSCRDSDAERYDKGHIQTRRGLFECERIILLLIADDPDANLYRGSLQLKLALLGVRNAHHAR